MRTRLFNPKLPASSALLVALAVLIAGCPGTPDPEPPALDPAPRILAFSATPTRVMGTGEITLAWDTEHATEVRITHVEEGALEGVDNAARGELTLTVDKQSLFVLTAANARGVTASAAVSVERESSVEEVQFFVSPSKVDPGQPVVVAWSAPGARHVTLSAGGESLDLLGQRATGSIVLNPTRSLKLVLQADDVSREAELVVRPKFLELRTEPAAMVPGMPLTLHWRTAAGTRLELIEASQGSLRAPVTDPAELATGSLTLQIPADLDASQVFTFSGRLIGTETQVEAQLPVYVAGNPRITSFEVPRHAREQGTLTMKWTTTQAARIEVRSADQVLFQITDPALVAHGTHTLPAPTAVTDYTLVAFGTRSGSVNLTRTSEPVALPTATLSASKLAIAEGGEEVVLSWNVTSAHRLRLRAPEGLHLAVIEGEVTSSSVSVFPNETTRYVLDVDNGAGDVVTRELTVEVGAEAPLVSYPAPPLVQDAAIGVEWSGGDDNTVIVGYPHGQVASATGSLNFIDIAQSGTPIGFSNFDDAVAFIQPEDFETFAWGARYDGRIAVATNGYLALTSTAAEPNFTATTTWPSTKHPPLMIAPFHTDLVLGPDSELRWEVVGQAPRRMLVVQWNDVVHFGAPGSSSYTFQAQLHQNGMVRFVYRSMNNGGITPVVRVGTQNWARTDAWEFTGAIGSGTEVTFFGPLSPRVPSKAVRGAIPRSAFVERGGSYLRARFDMPRVLQPNEVTFSELMVRPVAAIASTGEYVELRNHTDQAVDLHGFTVGLGAGTVVLDRSSGATIVPARGTLLLAQSGQDAANGGLSHAVGYVYGGGVALPDDGGMVWLEKGKALNTVVYTDLLVQAGTSVTFDGQRYRMFGTPIKTEIEPCLTPAGAVFGPHSQRGTPGEVGGCMGLVISSLEPDYWDIVGRLGTVQIAALPDTGQQFKKVNLSGGSFPFLDGVFSDVFVTSYGYLTFRLPTEPSLEGINAVTPLTAPSATSHDRSIVIYGLNMTLNPNNANTGIYYRLVPAGENPKAPDEHWIIQWHRVRQGASSATDDLNFQVKLFKDGTFEFHYALMSSTTASYASGASASVWIEDFDGSRALGYGLREAFLTPDMHHAVRFTRR